MAKAMLLMYVQKKYAHQTEKPMLPPNHIMSDPRQSDITQKHQTSGIRIRDTKTTIPHIPNPRGLRSSKPRNETPATADHLHESYCEKEDNLLHIPNE